MVHSVSGWTRGVQVELWDILRTRATPERLRGVFTIQIDVYLYLYLTWLCILWRRRPLERRWPKPRPINSNNVSSSNKNSISKRLAHHRYQLASSWIYPAVNSSCTIPPATTIRWCWLGWDCRPPESTSTPSLLSMAAAPDLVSSRILIAMYLHICTIFYPDTVPPIELYVHHVAADRLVNLTRKMATSSDGRSVVVVYLANKSYRSVRQTNSNWRTFNIFNIVETLRNYFTRELLHDNFSSEVALTSTT